MEKRLVIAIALSVLVLVAWQYIFPPPERPPSPEAIEGIASEPFEAPGPEALEEPELPGSTADAEPGADEPAEPDTPAVAAAAEEQVRVRTEVFDVTLTNRGGRALSWLLLQYPNKAGEPLELLPHWQRPDLLPLGFDVDDPRLSRLLNDALFEVQRNRVDATEGRGPGERIDFSWSDGRGLRATKSLTFSDDGYLVGVEMEVTDRGRPLNARLTVGPGFSAQDRRRGRSNYYYDSQAVWSLGGQVERRKKGKLEGEGGFAGNLQWAGLEDQFFGMLVLPGEPRAQLHWLSVERTAQPDADDEGEDPPEPTQVPLLGVTLGDAGGQLFVGPKQYTMLREMGYGLEDVVWFSSQAWLAWIVKHIYLGLIWIHDHVTPNYGLAIILATVVLRLLLFPINQYSMVKMKQSQLQMQKLQPKIKAIKNKYKKNKDAESRAKMNNDMMALYKKEGVNPMGGVTGCLPLLAQFPILIGFYNMLTVAVELRDAPFFGWIQDLSVKDPYMITPLLMGVTMFAQQKMAMNKIKDPQQLQQQRIMLFMPFMFTFICLQMPAGLVLYWFVNNLLGIGQQWLVNHHTSRLEQKS